MLPRVSLWQTPYALIKIYDDKKKLRHKLTLSTDEVGDMSFEATHIQDINDGYLLLAVKKEGYILYVQKLPIYLGSLWIKHFLLSKDLLPDSMRFVLSWADKPQDLDLHLKASDFHISYRNKRNITHVAALDRDARSGFGPETITLDKLKRDKSYQVLIYNYSKKPSFKGKAQLTIYKDNRLDRIIRLPKSSKRCFQVATMADGKVTYTTKAVDNKLCK